LFSRLPGVAEGLQCCALFSDNPRATTDHKRQTAKGKEKACEELKQKQSEQPRKSRRV
jgi:hypothetical protein